MTLGSLKSRLRSIEGLVGPTIYLVIIEPLPEFANEIQGILYTREVHRPPKWDDDGNIVGGGAQDRWFNDHLPAFRNPE